VAWQAEATEFAEMDPKEFGKPKMASDALALQN
jgi:hypothetical protein